VGVCFFWYRPTRVVPDQGPLNGCVCVCVGMGIPVCFTCRDQFARAFHKGSRPSSAVNGNVPSPIDHMTEPQYDSETHYGNYADEQSYMGPGIMPEGQTDVYISKTIFSRNRNWCILEGAWVFTAVLW